jgi:putative membrane protein
VPPQIAHVAGGFAPLEVVPIALAAILYWQRATTLSLDERPVPAWRQACFGAGLATIAIALFSPIGHISEELVIAHMGEHLLIGDVASLLLVVGLTRSLLQPLLAIRVFDRLQVLTHPAVAWKVGYVVAVRFTGAILGNVLMWSGSVLYPIYAPGEREWGISALADQSTAGTIMMVEGTFLVLGVLAWVFFEVAREGTEKQDLLDLARERGVELDEGRAQRAVAAGHGALLRERIGTGVGGGAEGRDE